MNPDKIGKFIYKLRTDSKLSQYQLADMIPISRQAVSKWERGQTIPDSSTLIRLSDIFHVSINELLKGERLSKDLETTTLSIVDESNKKTQKIRKIIVSFIITTMTLLLAFLSYYFVNSYNTIKVYTIWTESDDFIIHEGLFITAKQKTYMKLGKIIPKGDTKIEKVKVFYKKGKETITIFENEESDITLIDTFGYQEYFPEENIKDIINNTFIEISYNEAETEIIHLTFKRDFVNNFYFFTKQKKTIIDTNKEKEKNIIEQEIINYVKTKGTYQDESYILDIIDDKDEIRFTYFSSTNQVIMNINGETAWAIVNNKQFICHPHNIEQKDMITNNEECKEKIKEDVNKYLNKTG